MNLSNLNLTSSGVSTRVRGHGGNFLGPLLGPPVCTKVKNLMFSPIDVQSLFDFVRVALFYFAQCDFSLHLINKLGALTVGCAG